MVETKKQTKAPLGQTAVAETDAGQRLDRWLKAVFADVPYIGLQKLIRQGKVRINDVKAKADARLAAGDKVTYPTDFGARGQKRTAKGAAYHASGADMAMLEQCTVFEDEAMLVLNKPAGLPAQAGGGQVRSLDRILESVYGEKAPKLVHRLDRETTGLIVCAKNRAMAAALTAQFAARETEKTYLSVVVGKLPDTSGQINANIAKVGPFAKVDKKGDTAHTSWQWLASNGDLHLLTCVPHTGRMNQLRVHLAHIGLPMLGDDKYGNASVKAAGKMVHGGGNIPLYLHAWKLVIAHPKTGKALHLEAPLPEHVATFARRAGWKG